MRVLVASALVGLLAIAASASVNARNVDDHEQSSRFALREARVEPVATVADERFHMRGQVVHYDSAETLEALGFSLKSQLVAKGSGCTVPTAIFADGFE